MELTLLLDPIAIESLKIDLRSDSLYHSLYVYEEKLPRWQNMHIAIIGVNEYRGQDVNILSNGADKVRKKLYELKQLKHSLKITDLGNIKLGENLIDTQERLAEVCKLLIEENVLPFIIGGAHDLDIGQFKGYLNNEEDLKLLTIDSTLDIVEGGKLYENHSREILLHEPNILFNSAHLAYQTYLNHPNATDILEKMNCDHIRLGEIASDIKKIEPHVRFAHMISFDLASIKQSDFSANFNPQPFGLTAENVCQIAWYAGMSNECNSFGVYGYSPNLDERFQGAGVIAVMLWYFIDGYYHRKEETFSSENYKKFIVSTENEELVFYKDIRTEMWWAEIVIDKLKGKNKIEIIPCNYEDYLLASQGEVSQRLFDMKLKFV